jgi:hypothetical protein
MVDHNVKQLWYIFWSIEGTVLLSILWVVTHLCRWVIRRIFQNPGKRRPLKHSRVHWLDILQPPRKSEASGSETADLDPSDIKSVG